MQKGYWVSCYREIYDADKLAAYASGSGFKDRTVIVEWPTLDAAQVAYESEAYQAALDALSDGVDRDFRIIEGA